MTALYYLRGNFTFQDNRERQKQTRKRKMEGVLQYNSRTFKTDLERHRKKRNDTWMNRRKSAIVLQEMER